MNRLDQKTHNYFLVKSFIDLPSDINHTLLFNYTHTKQTPIYFRKMDMINKNKIQLIEDEINKLTKKRESVVNEWIRVIKKNDRDYEIYGSNSPHLLKKAEDLLREQRAIGKRIMRLLEKADNLTRE